MSLEISLRSSDLMQASPKRSKAKVRAHFLRLFEDVTDQLNMAVARRVSGGWTHAEIARSIDMDPAFLSRILGGQAGTNLRSVAAVLCAVDYVFKITGVPLGQPGSSRVLANAPETGALHFTKSPSGMWELAEGVEAAHDIPFYDSNYKFIFRARPIELSDA